MSRAKLSSVCGGLSIVVFLASSACVRKNEDLDRGAQPIQIDLPPAGQPADFDAIRAKLAAGDHKGEEHTGPRPGTCKNGCDVPSTIFSVGKTKNIRPDVALSKMQVIGEVINNDPTNTENAYKLKPNTTYLIWVAAAQPPATKGNEWGLFELPNQATGTSDRKTVGLVTSCHTYDNTLHKSDVDFKPPYKCDGDVSSRVHAATEASIWSSISDGWAVFRWAANRAGMLRLPVGLPEVWFECGSGCCTATGVVL